MEQYDLSHLDVLIVDRNPHMLAILRTALRELGMDKLRDVEDPDQAFQLFKDQQADLIISDWVPGRDELKFLNQIRDPKKSPNPFVPIIIVSSYSEQANVVAARDLGMTEFLAAPVSVMAIYERICSIINDKRLFIKEPKFFGPDRRRHPNSGVPAEERRKAVEPEAIETDASEAVHAENDASAAQIQDDEES